MIDQPILPRKTLYGLAVGRDDHLLHTGPMMAGAAPKIVWHTTEGRDFAAMRRVLIEKGAEPHILLDPVNHRLWQFIALDQYARALEHPAGTPETNRAGAIQVEICGYAREAAYWRAKFLDPIAALALLIEHRTGVRRIADLAFTTTPHRVSPGRWAGAHGHFGHQHVPNQPTGHWDPGALRIATVFELMVQREKG